MKGFIELNVRIYDWEGAELSIEKLCVNIKHIVRFGSNYVLTSVNNKYNDGFFKCEESYEQIKQLIKEAQG